LFPVVSFLNFVVTELVFFSVVGTDISHLRCGGIFSDSITTNVLLIQTVNKFENRSIFDEIKA